jgi:hypothetical protein
MNPSHSYVIAGKPVRFAFRIQIDEADSHPLSGGAQGHPAVYTGDVPIAGMPILFSIRANRWLNDLPRIAPRITPLIHLL